MKHTLFASAALSALLAITGTAQAVELKISHLRPQGAQVDIDINAYADEVAAVTGGDVIPTRPIIDRWLPSFALRLI